MDQQQSDVIRYLQYSGGSGLASLRKSVQAAQAKLSDKLKTKSNSVQHTAAEKDKPVPILVNDQGLPQYTSTAVTDTLILMQQAADLPAVPASGMLQVLQDVMYSNQRLYSQSTGLERALDSCCPDVQPESQQHVYSFEDEPQKLKNMMQGIQTQHIPTSQEPEIKRISAAIQRHFAELSSTDSEWCLMPPQQQDSLLPKMHLLAVARSSPKFSSIATILIGATDHQSVACAEAVICNPAFIAAVNLAGYPEAALTLLVFGHAYLAADLRGLTMYQRAQYMHERNLFIWQVRFLPVDQAHILSEATYLCCDICCIVACIAKLVTD